MMETPWWKVFNITEVGTYNVMPLRHYSIGNMYKKG